ncbi:hypothetical protein IFM89_024244 [Coptis chinensis]|uniref:Cytochrome P450 n=1 Tax=Coptis chinensis TaxID=261450 RepID=A0A835LNV7_9MAGN|nr:hypothetical protein IFM89_024244 [Coptis chinensis]
MKIAQEEVRRVTGKKLKRNENDISEMEYLKYVIKETLRLHPPLPLMVPRESTTTTTVKGYHVPSKLRVFINACAIQRDPNIWKNPEEFIPERFGNNFIDIKGQDYEYIPFGSGRRGCRGLSFGIAVAELVLANLLCWFDWEFPGGAEEELDMTEAFGLTVNKKTPLHLVPVSNSF